MANLDPLKFAVEIAGNAMQDLDSIQNKLNALKGETIHIEIKDAEDIQRLLALLQHQLVNNIGKDVGNAVNEAAKNLQQEAQNAIRASLAELGSNLTSIKEAIQHDNFTAFSKRIDACAESMNKLNGAFNTFKTTIGSDEGMRNFMTGLGEVIRNVRVTMSALNERGGVFQLSTNDIVKSVKVAGHEIKRLYDDLTRAQRVIESFGDKGFNVTKLESYKTELKNVLDNLRLIKDNNGIHPVNGMTASQYLSTVDVSRAISLLKTELGYYQSVNKELERMHALRAQLTNALETHGSKSSRDEINYLISGLDLREGLLGRLGVRDALKSLDTDAYREQLATITSFLNLLSAEKKANAQASRQNEQEDKKWAESMSLATSEAKKLESEISKLREIERSGRSMNLDTTNLSARISELENYLTILRSIEGGIKLHGHAKDLTGVISSSLNQAKGEAAIVTKHLTDQERQLAQALKSTTSEARGQSQVLSDLKSLATQYLGVWGAQSFLNNIIKIGGQLEQQRLSLTAILGQRSYADDLFGKIQDLAVKSPFGVVQLDQYSKNLSAFGFQYNELFDMTKRLADIAAGTGTDFGRLALALGHVRSEMALTGYTLRQFSMANVPMLQKLSENLGVTTSEIRKMVSEKKVSYADVEKVLKDLTDEGGMFYNMQEVMSDAVSAKFKNLKDSMDIMYGQIAESWVGDMLKGIAAALTEVTKRWQTFGTVLLTTAGILGVYKLYMHLLNVGIKTNTANILQNTVATQTLSAANVNRMVQNKLLTVQDIALALAEGRLTEAQARLALVSAGCTEAMVAQIAATNGLKGAWAGLKASSAGMIGFLTNPWTAVLFAVEAVVGAVMAYSSWSNSIYSDVENVLEKAKTSSEEIGKYLKEADKNGKPSDEQSLSAETEQMKTILKNSELYTEDLERQVGLTQTISDEYDVLIGKMREASKETDKTLVSAEALAEAIKHTSGEFWSLNVYENLRWMFNQDILKNLGQLETSRGSFTSMMGGALSQYRDQMQEVMNNMANNEEMLVGSGKRASVYFIEADMRAQLLNKSLEEQLRILSSDGNERYWQIFLHAMNVASSGFRRHADDMKDRLDDMNEDFEQVLNDDIPRLMESLWTEKGFKSKEEFRKWAESNTAAFEQMLTDIEAVLAEKAPSISGMLRGMLKGFVFDKKDFSLFNFLKVLSPEEEESIRLNNLRKGYGNVGASAKQTMQAFAQRVGKGENFFDDDFIAKYFVAGGDASAAIEKMGKRWKQLNKEIEANKKIGYQTPQEKLDEKEQLDIANQLYHFEKEKKRDKGDKDSEAKELRERVRILKEASDSYQYWLEKVGDSRAVTHVNEEFGQLLGEQGFNFDNIEKFRETLLSLREEYEKKPKSKAMLEALKELDKELAQLERREFEKTVDSFVSEMTRDIDELTRKWEIFNSVRDSTGDVSLASRMSGLAPGATPADLKRANVASFAGVGIDFDSVLGMSEKDIDEYVYTLDISEEKIQAVQNGLKDWKKAQEDVTKSDIQNYAKWLGTLVDYESQRVKIQNEYNTALEETDRLLKEGIITAEEARRREISAQVATETKGKEYASWYANLYGNANVMAKDEFMTAYQAELENLDQQLSIDHITLSTYTEKLRKLNEIAAEFSENGFLGIKGGVGSYLSGGVEGLIGYYRDRASKAVNDYGENSAEAKKWTSRADSLENMQKKAEQVANAFNDLSSGASMLADMFDALGMEGASSAFNDASSVLGGMGSGAMSLSSLGPWGMAAGAAIGGISSIAQLHDKHLEEVISALKEDVNALEMNTDAIKLFRGRTLGYDYGSLREQMGGLYGNSSSRNAFLSSLYGRDIFTADAGKSAMRDYYLRNGVGSGYQQELKNLEEERKKYLEMYDAESSRKKKSEESLSEYQKKIAELDDQIMYFTEDLANELWGIDIKGWADQISDALITAFENGEDAMSAFKDTTKSIMQSVASEMLKLGIIEPMLERLSESLFGKIGEDGQRSGGIVSTDELANDPVSAAKKIYSTIGEFFKPGGDGSNMVLAAEEYLTGIDNLMKQMGFSNGLRNNDNGNTLSSGIQGTSEETSALLAGYMNAMRQDVSVDRLLLSQFVSDLWPSYVEQVTQGISSLNNIDRNVGFIHALLSENGAIFKMMERMSSHLDMITTGGERVSVQ